MLRLTVGMLLAAAYRQVAAVARTRLLSSWPCPGALIALALRAVLELLADRTHLRVAQQIIIEQQGRGGGVLFSRLP